MLLGWVSFYWAKSNILMHNIQGPVSISNNACYNKISQSLEVARFHHLEMSDNSQITQQPCRCDCQISKREELLNTRYRTFETLRDLTIGHLIRYWNEAQLVNMMNIFPYTYAYQYFRDIWKTIADIGMQRKILNDCNLQNVSQNATNSPWRTTNILVTVKPVI